jgi:hypothetical protein
MTDTARTATEQLLISNAVDQAVSQIDFRPLAGKTVFCDPQYLDGTVDRGYVISSVRQQLLAIGATLHDERNKAEYVVEVRSGAIGTDRHSLLVGVPQMTVPAIVPGQPSQIPEIPVAKKTDEQGVAKIALFAYNRHTGQRLWQSGTVQSVSDARDFWIAGLGPFRAGTIVHGTELAGRELPNPLHLEFDSDGEKSVPPGVPVTSAAAWNEPPSPQYSVTGLLRAFATLVPKWPMPSAAVEAQSATAAKQVPPDGAALKVLSNSEGRNKTDPHSADPFELSVPSPLRAGVTEPMPDPSAGRPPG